MDEVHHHQCGVDRWVEKAIKVIVGEGLCAAFKQALEAPAIGAEDQQRWGIGHPGHVGDQCVDRCAPCWVANVNEIGLLQETLGWCRECASREQLHERGRYWSCRPCPMRYVTRDAQQLGHAAHALGQVDCMTEAGGQHAAKCSGFIDGVSELIHDAMSLLLRSFLEIRDRDCVPPATGAGNVTATSLAADMPRNSSGASDVQHDLLEPSHLVTLCAGAVLASVAVVTSAHAPLSPHQRRMRAHRVHRYAASKGATSDTPGMWMPLGRPLADTSW